MKYMGYQLIMPLSFQVNCINLCCPHGQVLVTNTNFDPEDYSSNPFICGAPLNVSELQHHYNTELDVRDRRTDARLRWERNNHYLLVSQAPAFKCPAGYLPDHAMVPEAFGEFSVVNNGSLRGTHQDINGTKTDYWQPDAFCLVIGALPEPGDYSYDYYGEDEEEGDNQEPKSHPLRRTFMHCIPEEPVTSEDKFTSVFHPFALSISVVFLIIILIVYSYDKTLHGNIVGKITIGFVINLICCYISIIDGYVKDFDSSYDRRGTAGCVLGGYAILYFFHAYFFWLNAMAIHIWLSFTNLVSVNVSEKMKLALILIYAQGVPAILCVLTAIIDSSSPPSSDELQYYPEMGVYNCYLGSQYTPDTPSYFQTPVFIYQQSILILSMLANILLLIHVTIRYCSTPQSGQGVKRTDLAQQLSTFVKIFFILGFTWICEVITTALHVEHKETTFYHRLVLDIINLFLVRTLNNKRYLSWNWELGIRILFIFSTSAQALLTLILRIKTSMFIQNVFLITL